MSSVRMVQAGLVLLLLLVVAGVVWAGTSASPALEWGVLSGGGAPASAGAVTLSGSLGQTAIGPSISGRVTLGAGFWYGVGQGKYLIYLPIVLRNS